MQIRRRILSPAKRKRLDRPIPVCHHPVDQMRLEKPLRLEMVHEVVRVIRGLMTFHAPRLAKEQLLAAHFRRIRLLRIEFSVHAELSRCPRISSHSEWGVRYSSSARAFRGERGRVDAFPRMRT